MGVVLGPAIARKQPYGALSLMQLLGGLGQRDAFAHLGHDLRALGRGSSGREGREEANEKSEDQHVLI